MSQGLDPRRSALVMVGMQNDYCSPDGVNGRAGHDLTRVQEAARAIATLAESCREAGWLTVFVRTEHGHDDAVVWQGRRRAALSPVPTSASTWGAEFFLPTDTRDLIVTKRRYSAFSGTTVEETLHAQERTTLVVAGVQTHVSVLATVIAACDRDFRVFVVEDAVAAYSEEATEWALRTVAAHFGRLTTCADIVRQTARAALRG